MRTKKTNTIVFTQISPNEHLFTHKKEKYLLVEKSRGVYGLGSSVQLYHLNGINRTHVKEIGWTKSDNHGCSGMSSSCIPHITTIEACKTAAVKYLDLLT